MANSSKAGTDWSVEEVDAIVALYFDMLAQPSDLPRGWKADRIRRLDAQIERGKGSIGQKLSNISSVAPSLGIPPLVGFGARPNAQTAVISAALERYLDAHPEAWAIGVADLRIRLAQRQAADALPVPGFAQTGRIFSFPTARKRAASALPDIGSSILPIDPPPPPVIRRPKDQELARVVGKFDPAARDQANRDLGRLGEQHVYDHERASLVAAGQLELADAVEWTSRDLGDGAGYDIKSFDPITGDERLIEVKATYGGATADFFLTRRERAVSEANLKTWRLYRIYGLPSKPRLFILEPPLEQSVTLVEEGWRAKF